MKEEAEIWWKQALRDLETADYLLDAERYDAVAFFAQQSVEKALKSMHIDRYGKLKKTHDLVLLAKGLELPQELIDFCKELSPAYVYTRYPDVVPVQDIEEVSKELLGYAKEIMEWIRERR
jgi:HEPN domain-containing protein